MHGAPSWSTRRAGQEGAAERLGGCLPRLVATHLTASCLAATQTMPKVAARLPVSQFEGERNILAYGGVPVSMVVAQQGRCTIESMKHSTQHPSHASPSTLIPSRLPPLQVLQYFDLEHVNKWAWLGWEALFFAGFVVAAWAALSLVRHQRR